MSRAAGSISLLVLTAALAMMPGCTTPPPRPDPAEFMRPGPDALASQQVQTQRFSEVREAELLAASAGVMQDLGFLTTVSDARLGLVIGRKTRPTEEQLADLGKQIVPGMGRAILKAFTFQDISQEIRVANAFVVVLTTRPVGGEARAHDVRVIFYLEFGVVATHDAIRSPALYEEFFGLLRQALFRSPRGN